MVVAVCFMAFSEPYEDEQRASHMLPAEGRGSELAESRYLSRVLSFEIASSFKPLKIFKTLAQLLGPMHTGKRALRYGTLFLAARAYLERSPRINGRDRPN